MRGYFKMDLAEVATRCDDEDCFCEEGNED
jgi:hypothetical protein